MKKLNDKKYWQKMSKEESLFTAGQGVKWFSYYGNQNGGFSQSKNSTSIWNRYITTTSKLL